MTHIGLFEGIGGFSLAARWMGWETIAWCEWNEFGQKVLKHHFPNAKPHGDITKTDFNVYRGQCDILTGGFPCQPYSAAGKRLGKEDDRHLWPEMLRAIREIQPSWVVGENVRGLTNWNGGMVFDEVQADLEAEGYEVLPFLLPACAVNAPHRRDRIWFVAYNNSFIRGTGRDAEPGEQSRHRESHADSNSQNDGFVAYAKDNDNRKQGGTINRTGQNEQGRNAKIWAEFTGHGKDESTPNSNGTEQGTNIGTDIGTEGEIRRRNKGDVFGGFFEPGDATNTDKERQCNQEQIGELARLGFSQHNGRNTWAQFPTQSPICSRDDGIPGGLDGITFPKWRNESIKAYGNAIVPQVAYQIFKAIQQYEISTNE